MKKFNDIVQKIKQLKQNRGIGTTFFYLIKKGFYKVICVMIPALILIPVFLLLALFFRVRLIALFSDRIGHYALNTELLLCTLDTQSELKKNKYLFYTCASYVPLCNTQLDRMWRRCIPILPFPDISDQIDKFLAVILGSKYRQDPIKLAFEPTFGDKDINGLLEKIHQPHLSFTKREEELGRREMKKWGVPVDAQFICLLVRDEGYLQQHLPSGNWDYQKYRNADVMNYNEAALFLAEKGYYVIRMGKYTEKKFEVRHPKIIDYATSELRSDFMDIYLLSRCYFFISTSTGLDSISQIFRRPGVFTNAVLPIELPTWYPCLLFVPKKIKRKLTGNVLSFKEIYSAYLQLNKMDSDTLRQQNLEVVDNSPQEILAVIQEMEARLNGCWEETIEDQDIQQRFWADFPRELKNLIDASSYAKNITIKIGRDFLREQASLLN